MKVPKIKKGQQKLTKAQEALLKPFAEKQIKRYLSTKQFVSDKTIKTYVGNAYKVGNLKAPKIMWFDSPEASSKHWASVRDSVRASVWASVRDSVRASVWASVRASVWDSVRASVRDSVRASVRDSVRASVGASVGDSVRDSVWAYYDSDYLSHYKFFNDYFQKNDLVWLQCLSENVTGYYFYEKECWLVRKPIRLTRNSEGRLHNEKEKAIEWKDGFGFYFWHGVQVPEKFIKGKLTRKDFIKEENAELRRIMIEILGDNAFVQFKATKIDTYNKSSKDYHRYILYSLPLAKTDPDKEAKYLQMKDASTPRVYYIPVLPTLTSAKDALLWYLNLDDDKFEQEG